jgi:hypothetical protein
MKVGLCDLKAVCMSVYVGVFSPINFRLPESVFMKLYIYSMAPESISTAYFINPSHQSVCPYVYPPSLLGNGSVKIPLSLLGKGWVKTLLRRRIHSQ